MAICNSFLYVYQRVGAINHTGNDRWLDRQIDKGDSLRYRHVDLKMNKIPFHQIIAKLDVPRNGENSSRNLQFFLTGQAYRFSQLGFFLGIFLFTTQSVFGLPRNKVVFHQLAIWLPGRNPSLVSQTWRKVKFTVEPNLDSTVL